MINPSRVSTHENLNTIQLSAAMNEYWTILTFAAQKDFPNWLKIEQSFLLDQDWMQ